MTLLIVAVPLGMVSLLDCVARMSYEILFFSNAHLS